MRRVLRYQVPINDMPHPIPLTGPPLAWAAGNPAGWVEFWAEYDTSLEAKIRAFQVYGTGAEIPADAGYVGTCPRDAHGGVWHLYERGL